MAFPATRLRRLRQTGVLRGLVRETELSVSHLVYPMFVVAAGPKRTPIAELPGIDHVSIDGAVEEAGIAHALGIPAVLLFGLPASKDDEGSGAWDDEGVIQLATRAIKAAHPDLLVITDLCLCEYTSHGHCGVLRPDGVVDNDQTLELLARTAVSQARGGCGRRRAERHDGRPRGRAARRARRARVERDAADRLLAPSTRPRSTARSASPPTPRPRRATARATRWIPANALEACARRSWTWRRAPTS